MSPEQRNEVTIAKYGLDQQGTAGESTPGRAFPHPDLFPIWKRITTPNKPEMERGIILGMIAGFITAIIGIVAARLSSMETYYFIILFLLGFLAFQMKWRGE